MYRVLVHVCMINTQTLEKDKAKTYKSNLKARKETFAASGGT